MRSLTRWLLVTSATVATIFACFPGTTFADDAKDCNTATPPRAVQACTTLLTNGALSANRKAYYLALRARALLEQGQFAKADEDLVAAFKLAPTYAFLFGVRGRSLSLQNKADEAERDFAQYLSLSDDKFNPLIARANHFVRAKKYDEALKDYSDAKVLRSASGTPYVGIAVVMRRRGDLKGALAELDSGLRVDSANPGIFVERGEVNLELKQYQLALGDFDLALDLAPGSKRALAGRERATAELAPTVPTPKKDTPKASPPDTKADPKGASTAKASPLDLLIEKGKALRAKGEWDDAIKAYDDALKLDPKNAMALYWRALCLEKLSRFEDAISAYSKALPAQTSPETSELAAIGLARVSIDNLKVYREPVDLLSIVIRTNPKSEDAYRLRIKARFLLGRFDEAAGDAAQAAALNPKKVDFLGWRALALAGAAKTELAMEATEQALKLEKQNALALAARAWVHLQQGKTEQAEQDAKRAVGGAGDSPEVNLIAQIVMMNKLLKDTDARFAATKKTP